MKTIALIVEPSIDSLGFQSRKEGETQTVDRVYALKEGRGYGLYRYKYGFSSSYEVPIGTNYTELNMLARLGLPLSVSIGTAKNKVIATQRLKGSLRKTCIEHAE